MAALNQVYEPQEDLGGTIYPPGDYPIRIEGSETQDTKAGTGQFIKLTIMVLDGDIAGTEITDRINFDNPNPIAVEIAKKTMGQLAFILNKPLSDDQQLLGLECILRVTVTEPKNGKPAGNNFKYLPKDTVSAFAPQTATKPAAAASGGAPWKQKAA